MDHFIYWIVSALIINLFSIRNVTQDQKSHVVVKGKIRTFFIDLFYKLFLHVLILSKTRNSFTEVLIKSINSGM